MDKGNLLAYMGGIVRIATTLLGGFLAQKGLATEAETEGLVGAGVVVATGVWSIWAKRKALAKVPPAAAGCVLLCALMIGASGCVGMSEKKIAAAGKIADSYYNSANVAELWTVTSSNGNGKEIGRAHV